jgi:predicted RecA/RadA family phage recombinase
MAQPEARLLAGHHEVINVPAPGAVTSGEVLKLADNRVGIVTGLNLGGVVSGDPIAVAIEGPVRLPCASGVTFSAGARAYWSISGNTVVVVGSAATGDPDLGPVIRAKTSGQLTVDVDLNAAAGTVKA